MWLSEQDFRQLFAEAIFAGQPENGASPELSTGLMMIDNSDDSKKNITWFYNPMFQHCIKENQDGELVSDGQKGRGVPVKAQLQEAINPAEVYEIIHDAFSAKLRLTLQIEESRPIVDLTADTLGIDSLFAVDIRSWFIKELQIEIPVLKILGGATVGDILETAQQLLPKEFTPNLDPNDKSEARKQKPQVTSAAKDKLADQTAKKVSIANEKPNDRKTDTKKKGSAADEKPNDRKADTTKARAATPPSVQWSLPKPPTPSEDSDNSSLSSDSGVRVSPASPITTYTGKSTPSSNAGSEIDAFKGRSQGSVWSMDTTDSEVAVSKKTPIAFGQSRIWFLEIYLKDPASALNITLTIDLNGSLDVNRFERAVKHVGQRHEALRTRFVTGDDSTQTMQEVLVDPTLALEKQDIAGDAEAEQIYRELQQYRYKLTEGENMRILLLKKSSKSFRLIIGYHHINMDGISLEVVLRELQMAYDSKRLPSVSSILQYPAFAEQQHREFESGKWQNEISFWVNEFGGHTPPVLPLLPLAKTRSRTPLTTYSTHTAEFRLDQEALTRIQSVCSGSKATPFQFHLAVFHTLLSRLVDAEEICIGISSANRQDTAMQSVGMYLNLLPLLLKSQPNETFASTLKLIRSKAMAAFAHSKVPFDVIVNKLGVPRATTHSPLFQVLVNYRPGIAERRDFCDCRSQVMSFEQGQAAYDLSLDVIESPGECRIIVAGQSALFGPQDVDMLKEMYKQLLVAFSRNPALRLTTPSLYDPEDVKNGLQLGQGSLHAHQWPETLVHRIDKMVEQYGNRPAVVDGCGISLTYSQLARRVGALAASMRGIGSGSRVGLYVDPGVDWICSLLAILRRDAVYVPLDAVSGSARLFAILQDSKPDLLLVNKSTEKDAMSQFAPLLTADQILNVDHVSTTAVGTVSNTAKADSVAALLYTSGSTGVPKGIIMKHASFRNNIEIITDRVGYREGQEVTLQQSSFNFDMSVFQVFLALSNGGTIHVVPRHLRADPVAISAIIASGGITFTTATPFGARQAGGGEPVRDSLQAAFQNLNKPGLRLVDCYGPTEITFFCHSREVDYQVEATSSNLGLEILPNYSTYIVDASMEAVPVGIPGEILIGGAGVVAGYLHTELNTRGFAHNSFASPEFHKQGWTQLHRTGDFGRISKVNGRLLLEGRIADDTQVKLRGLRVDLREVESAIIQAANGTIVDCAVSIRQPDATADEYLVAFATSASAAKENLDQIIHQLPLPQYMRPAALIILEKMPTNASGKIDRSALKSIPLPQPGDGNGLGGQQSGSEILSSTESSLKQLWEGVLSKEILSQRQITTTSDFFHVGGSSMLLISLRADIQDTFNIAVSLFQLFDSSTLGGMATLINILSNKSSGDLAYEQDQTSDIEINWESETAVSPALRNVPVNKQFFTNPEIVILTGSTGFLGQQILMRLLNDGVVKKIHCLAVRHDIPLFNSPKVVVHRGDLGLPGFGLSEDELSKIFSEAHAIIHNGTDVSFVKTYHSLKPANVKATKELVRLSLPHHTSFHYISTAAVTNLTGQDSWEQRSVGGFLPPVGADGYLSTKWVSERYLEKVNDLCELPIWIHRPSSITGPDAPATDLMENLIQFSRKIAAIPDTSSWSGWLDFISVDRAAMQIVDEVYEDYSWPGHVKYLYESGEQVVALSDMKGVLERESGSIIETVSMEEWVSKAVEEGLNPLLGEYLKRASGTPLVFPKLNQPPKAKAPSHNETSQPSLSNTDPAPPHPPKPRRDSPAQLEKDETEIKQKPAGFLRRRVPSSLIIMIGHSMGGLVIKKAYALAHQDPVHGRLAERIRCIFFLATPHKGSEYAPVLNKILSMTGITSSREYVSELSQGSTSARIINEDFGRYASTLRIYSFFETLETNLGISSSLIVDKDSAILGPGFRNETSRYMNANHRGIYKFDSLEDPNYLSLKNSLATVVQDLLQERKCRELHFILLHMPRLSSTSASSPRRNVEDAASQAKELHWGIGPPPDENHEQLEGSCLWIDNLDHFRQWRDAEVDISPCQNLQNMPSIYWVTANPGAGKTVLAAHIVNQLVQHHRPHAFYYFKVGKRASLAGCLRSLAFQMATVNSAILSTLSTLSDDDATVDLDDARAIWLKVFKAGILQTSGVTAQYWVLDALDECFDYPELFKFLKGLQVLLPLKIFITSRKLPDLPKLVRQLGDNSTHVVELPVIETMRDIDLYIRDRMQFLPIDKDEDKENLAKEISSKSKASFLWVRLVLDELESVYGYESIKSVLHGIPEGMLPYYRRIITGMQGNKREKHLIQTVLTWVVCASRPLTILELSEALRIDINVNLASAKTAVEALCGQIISVDKNSGLVQIVHATAIEFLLLISFEGDEVATVVCEGPYVAVGFRQGNIRLYSHTSYHKVLEISHAYQIECLAFDPSGAFIVSACAEYITVWDLDGVPLWQKPLGSRCRLLTASSAFVICVTLSGQAIWWDVATGEQMEYHHYSYQHPVSQDQLSTEKQDALSPEPPEISPHAGSLSPGLELLALAYGSRPISILDLRTCECVAWAFDDNCKKVIHLAFNPNPEINALLVGYDDSHLSLYEPWSGTLMHSREPHTQAALQSLSCSRDGRTFSTMDADGNLRIWEFESLTPLYHALTPASFFRSLNYISYEHILINLAN
ncbi:hypothetical protein NUW58_g2929 [Xylaria curta]|uniref:Uncharacterized protein n=1 Tax=Xylaria curta TaxID=42375 RepID=A0ACC1PF14_9PEZI|nr:hypothetical protein NUW58_g2929 [Xylaria curta]